MKTSQIETIPGRYQAEDVLVQYQDVANPLRVGQIVEHVAGEYRVIFDAIPGHFGEDDLPELEIWTDLRQYGWSFATPGSIERRDRDAAELASRRLADSKQISWTADHGSGFRYTLKRLATGRGQLFVTDADGTIRLVDDTIADYSNFVFNYLRNAASATDLEVIA